MDDAFDDLAPLDSGSKSRASYEPLSHSDIGTDDELAALTALLNLGTVPPPSELDSDAGVSAPVGLQLHASHAEAMARSKALGALLAASERAWDDPDGNPSDALILDATGLPDEVRRSAAGAAAGATAASASDAASPQADQSRVRGEDGETEGDSAGPAPKPTPPRSIVQLAEGEDAQAYADLLGAMLPLSHTLAPAPAPG